MDMSGWDPTLDPTYNQLTGGSVYPSDGASVALAATGPNRRGLTSAGSNSSAVPINGSNSAGAPMPAGSFVGGLAVFLVLAVVLMIVAHRFGEEGDFSNIKGTSYNILFIGLIAIIGVPVVKVGLVWLAGANIPLVSGLASHGATWALAA